MVAKKIEVAVKWGNVFRSPVFLMLALIGGLWIAWFLTIVLEWMEGPSTPRILLSSGLLFNVSRPRILLVAIELYMGLEASRYLLGIMPQGHKQLFWAGLKAKDFEAIVTVYWLAIFTLLTVTPLSALLQFPVTWDIAVVAIIFSLCLILFVTLFFKNNKLNADFLRKLLLPVVLSLTPGINILFKLSSSRSFDQLF